ncbi:MAG: tRNA pseudouridine(55) synthase TruB [Candidatus Binatia bacterium]
MQSGVLVLDKPEGPSSAQVVERVKKILGARKVGHLGTLDPFASGLLPMGIEEGTKIAGILLAARKSYAGVMVLGIETDTQDKTGKVVNARPVAPVNKARLEDLRAAFTGSLHQIPPMYSALKRSGVRLYELARRGESVPRGAREITVERLELWQVSEAEIGFEVRCSKGTYIRTLAADMGEFLGCGAHLRSLRRLSCGSLTLDQAVSLADLEQLSREEVPLIPLSAALSHLPKMTVNSDSSIRLRMGQQEILAGLAPPRQGETLARIADEQGVLVALVRWADEENRVGWRLARIFSSGARAQDGVAGYS